MTPKSSITIWEQEPVGLPGDCPGSYLFLSEVGEVESEHARSVADIYRMLDDIDGAIAEAEHSAAVEDLIDYVWGPLTEAEARYAWGDR